MSFMNVMPIASSLAAALVPQQHYPRNQQPCRCQQMREEEDYLPLQEHSDQLSYCTVEPDDDDNDDLSSEENLNLNIPHLVSAVTEAVLSTVTGQRGSNFSPQRRPTLTRRRHTRRTSDGNAKRHHHQQQELEYRLYQEARRQQQEQERIQQQRQLYLLRQQELKRQQEARRQQQEQEKIQQQRRCEQEGQQCEELLAGLVGARSQHPKQRHSRPKAKYPPQADSNKAATPKVDVSLSAIPVQRGSTTLNLSLQIPSRDETQNIQVPDNCTVEALLNGTRQDVEDSGLDISLQGSTIVFNGKTLTESPHEQLMSFGVKNGSELMVGLSLDNESTVLPDVSTCQSDCSGETLTDMPSKNKDQCTDLNDPAVIKLLEIVKMFDHLKKELETPLIDAKLRDKANKMFVENSMKLLYRLDALEGLPSDRRQQRKDIVSAIQRMQDEVTATKIE